MTRLELVTGEPGDSPFSTGEPLPRRLPPGRHGIPANLVVEHQRRRLLAAMAEALAEHGYGGVTTTHVSELANVSTSTFYKHFGNLWDCVLAAYVDSADRLCEEIDVVEYRDMVVIVTDRIRDLIAKERSIAEQKAAESGKPAEIVAKMVDGSVQKYLKEVSLLNQPFVKNDKQTIEQMLKAAGASVQKFALFVVGEGIEKRQDDFAAEVAAQVAAAKQG